METNEPNIPAFIKLMTGPAWLHTEVGKGLFRPAASAVLTELGKVIGCQDPKVIILQGARGKCDTALFRGELADGTSVKVVFEANKMVVGSFNYCLIDRNNRDGRFFWGTCQQLMNLPALAEEIRANLLNDQPSAPAAGGSQAKQRDLQFEQGRLVGAIKF